jgi:hypothetical protein
MQPQPVLSLPQSDTYLGIEMNYEIVCNHLKGSFQVGPSSTSPVDLDGFWGY